MSVSLLWLVSQFIKACVQMLLQCGITAEKCVTRRTKGRESDFHRWCKAEVNILFIM